MREKSYRRQRVTLAKAKCRRIIKEVWGFKDPEWVENYVMKNHKNRAKCSCAGCGNPRRHFKGKDRLTVAERRAEYEPQ
jgi:hypothetical protein